jgi:hypothetical protein
MMCGTPVMVSVGREPQLQQDGLLANPIPVWCLTTRCGCWEGLDLLLLIEMMCGIPVMVSVGRKPQLEQDGLLAITMTVWCLTTRCGCWEGMLLVLIDMMFGPLKRSPPHLPL